MSQRRHEHDVGIARIDQYAADLPAVGETDERPVPARIGRLIHAIAMDDVGAHVRFA